MRITATITQKGQITIPKAIRKHFSGKIVEFIVQENGQIVLQDVPSVAGTLSEYAHSYTPLEQARDHTWNNYAK